MDGLNKAEPAPRCPISISATWLGTGNSGVVFKANDQKEEREVALKVYCPNLPPIDEDLQRFIRAVKTMLPIRHPNLVTLYGGGKTGPYCWMAMEYVNGENLKQTIQRIGKEGKIDWRPALHVAIGIARGLFYLHNEKIIHRNLSPTNILFSRLGVAKMGSLILAKALSGTLAKDVTMGNNVLGEVHYQAPEQVGAGGGVDGRADIYSLGALMYALLTGRPPFVGANTMETATWILQREPPPPRNINPSIPRGPGRHRAENARQEADRPLPVRRRTARRTGAAANHVIGKRRARSASKELNSLACAAGS